MAYFTEGRAIKGHSDYQLEWSGATWYFNSAKHRKLFLDNPGAYAPAFGGYCAYGVAIGSLLKIEGEQWAIVEDRLYLNFDKTWMAKWQKDSESLIMMAQATYADLVNEGD